MAAGRQASAPMVYHMRNLPSPVGAASTLVDGCAIISGIRSRWKPRTPISVAGAASGRARERMKQVNKPAGELQLRPPASADDSVCCSAAGRSSHMEAVQMSRRPFNPTAKQRRWVEAMIGYGIPEAEICRLIEHGQTAI